MRLLTASRKAPGRHANPRDRTEPVLSPWALEFGLAPHAVILQRTAGVPTSAVLPVRPAKWPRPTPRTARRSRTYADLAAALVADSLRGDGGYAVAAFIVAFVYFVCWLSAGADMLWEWHCTSLPAARMCVRCAHTAAAHRTRASCAVRAGSLKVWRRCPCAGYIPPGQSPETVTLTAWQSGGRAQRTVART
jgi:hypothetical protein